MDDLPRGTVTLLFTDIEGSTQLQHRLGADRYQEVVAEHRRLLESEFAEHNGVVVDRQTESFFVAFARARDAVEAAASSQKALATHSWPEEVPVRVRMGVHSGDPELAGDRYVGLAVSRAARICASAYGGQVLLSSSTRALLSDHSRSELRDLGAYPLKDFPAPERLSQLVVEGLPAQFPPLRTRPAPSYRRRLLMGAAAVVVALVAIAVAAFATRGPDAVEVGETSLAVVDPRTNEVAHAVDLGFKSNLIAAGEGFVWVVDPNGSTLWRIDPETHEKKGFGIAVGAGTIPFGLAVGEGSVWVAVLRGTRQVVLELGPEVGDLLNTIPYGDQVDAPVLFRLNPLAVGDGAVWAIDAAVGGVWRIPRDGRRPRKLAEGLDALTVAAGRGGVWVGGASGITKLDPLTGIELGSVSAGPQGFGETAAISLGSGAVWFSTSSSETLSKVDPQSVAIVQTFRVGKGPSGISVGEGAVWVANSRDGTVSRVDSQGSEPRTIPVGQTPGGIVASYGSVWASPGEPRS
ncbi:MAG TPA: adenylate/guanylate cyclase domain-containing protein [Gaiellaceae bacterium]|nr:adenylate/guanylate cyclase domain-containing protein [Gaiellaceae bacterium]